MTGARHGRLNYTLDMDWLRPDLAYVYATEGLNETEWRSSNFYGWLLDAAARFLPVRYLR